MKKYIRKPNIAWTIIFVLFGLDYFVFNANKPKTDMLLYWVVVMLFYIADKVARIQQKQESDEE